MMILKKNTMIMTWSLSIWSIAFPWHKYHIPGTTRSMAITIHLEIKHTMDANFNTYP